MSGNSKDDLMKLLEEMIVTENLIIRARDSVGDQNDDRYKLFEQYDSQLYQIFNGIRSLVLQPDRNKQKQKAEELLLQFQSNSAEPGSNTVDEIVNEK